MSASPPESNLDQLDEQLVAYLDGELEPVEARRLEDQLASDERARTRLNQLASSWDLLDQLPRAVVDEDFARTTVEMAAVATEEELAQTAANAPLRRRVRAVTLVAITLLAVAVGYAAVELTTPRQNEALLDDLPVIVNLDLYRPVGCVDLLRQLQQADLFTSAEMPPVQFSPGPSRYERGESRRDPRSAVPNVDAPERKITHVPVKFDERRTWLMERPAEEKLALQRKFDRFSALSPAEQTSLRGLDAALANEDYEGPLSIVLLRYSDWLDTQLSLADRGALEDMTVEKKVDYVQRRMTRVFAFFLTRWLHEYGQRHEAELRELTADDTRESPSERGPGDRVPGDSGPGGNRWRNAARTALEVLRDPKIDAPQPTAEELQQFKQLVQQVSPDKELKQKLASAGDATDEFQIIRRWLQDSELGREPMANRGPGWGPWSGPGFGQGGRRFNRGHDFRSRLSEKDREAFDKLPPGEKLKLWRDHRDRGGPPPEPTGPKGPRRGPPGSDREFDRRDRPPRDPPMHDPSAHDPDQDAREHKPLRDEI